MGHEWYYDNCGIHWELVAPASRQSYYYCYNMSRTQVSHHPPACAQHVEHKDWTFWQDYTMTSKFRGKYLQIVPYGEVCIN